MGRSYNPGSFVSEVSERVRLWAQSVHVQLNGNLEFGTPVGNTPKTGFGVNNGVYTQFKKANTAGVLIRIAGHGVAGSGAPYVFPAAGSLVINHGLLKQPIGFHVVDADKDVRIYRTAAPDATQLTITASDLTASVTLHIF